MYMLYIYGQGDPIKPKSSKQKESVKENKTSKRISKRKQKLY